MQRGTDIRLTRDQISRRLVAWYDCWTRYDLEGVLSLFDDRVRYDHWDGRTIQGRPLLRFAWSSWFARADFRFHEEETFIDEHAQKAVYRWRLTWPSSSDPNTPGERSGVDVLHFRDGLIVRKMTYSRPEQVADEAQ